MKSDLIVTPAATTSLSAVGSRTGTLAPEFRAERRPSIHVLGINGRASERPQRFLIDGCAQMTDLAWRDWGMARATAVGDLQVSAGVPDSAGRTVHYRAQLQLRGHEEVGGESYYTEYRVVGNRWMPSEVRLLYGTWRSAFPSRVPPERGEAVDASSASRPESASAPSGSAGAGDEIRNHREWVNTLTRTRKGRW